VTPDRLRQVPLFADLDEETLSLAASLFTTEHVSEGRFVIHQGDLGDRFYIVIRGAVEVLVAHATEVARRMAVLEIGDHFGEIALLQHVRRTASLRTLRASTFLALQRTHFELLLQRAPHLRARMEDMHGARLSQCPTD
jgi:ATP-binding cassette subfamily B protein